MYKTVKITVDRPKGSCHPRYPDLYYPVNYGYVDGVTAPDGEEQDVYILGVDEAVAEFCGRVIAIIRRLNDDEDKLVVAPDGVLFDREMSELICYPSGKTGRRYTLPHTVTRIAPHAFSACGNLKEVAFDGTEKEWKNVYVCSGNESLHAAILSFARNEK